MTQLLANLGAQPSLRSCIFFFSCVTNIYTKDNEVISCFPQPAWGLACKFSERLDIFISINDHGSMNDEFKSTKVALSKASKYYFTSEEQKTMSPERSADESENQETESVISNDTESIIEEKDLGCGTKAELKTFPLSSTCVTSDVSEYDEDGFVLVRRGRRSRGQGVKAATLEGDHQFKHPVPHAYTMTKKTSQSSTKTSGVAKVQPTFQLFKNNVRANEIPSKNRSQDRSSALTSGNISISKELSQETSKGNFVSTGLSYAASLKKLPPPAARGDSGTSSRRKRVRKSLMEDTQAMPNDLKSYSASSHVQAGSTVSASQELESNVAPRVPLADTSFQLREVGKIPLGIRVVCDHFLQVYPLLPPGTTTASPCEDCKSHNKLKYATWNSTRLYWQEIRPYPALKVPPKATLKVCCSFVQNWTCSKLLCPFPHGKVELAMWTMERKGGKYQKRIKLYPLLLVPIALYRLSEVCRSTFTKGDQMVLYVILSFGFIRCVAITEENFSAKQFKRKILMTYM